MTTPNPEVHPANQEQTPDPAGEPSPPNKPAKGGVPTPISKANKEAQRYRDQLRALQSQLNEGDRNVLEVAQSQIEDLQQQLLDQEQLRQQLTEQEPLVAAAREAERAQMSELERAQSDYSALQQQLAQRDTELLQARYGITEDYLEFIGDGTFEEKEARAAKIGLMVQSAKHEDPAKPPSQRPVESLRPGASPTPPPVADTSYPASWGFQPPTQ